MTCYVRALFVVLLSAFTCGATDNQVQYATGQNVVPVYEGWKKNPDGSVTMMFGYMNRNYEEQLDLPVGEANRFEPGDADRGQPTHFFNRRQMYVFEVVVPAEWGNRDLVWTLTAHGRTDRAFGSLKPDYELSDVVIRENRIQDMGQGGGEPNKAPTIALVGPPRRNTGVAEGVSLVVSVDDDGFPTPRPRRTGGGSGHEPKPNPVTQAVVNPRPDVGLSVTWVHYRGAGTVTFSPASPPITAGRATTTATFSRPGSYVLRAYADDSVLTATTDVTVVVSDR
jgi:hypothetical protein